MTKNTFAVMGILVVLLLSLGLTSALVSQSNVTITLDKTSLVDIVTGNTYTIVATIENLNNTDFYVDFSTTGWDSWTVGKPVTVGASETFTGTFTATTAASKGAYATVYNASNTSQELFKISRTFSIEYAGVEISGCTDSTATNYDSTATTDDGSCTYTTSDTLCELEGYTEKGNLEISDFDVNNKGDGKDDEWQLLDNLEITVEAENNGNDNIEDVEVKIVIMDNKIENGGKDVTNDFDIEDEVLTSIGKLRDGDQESVIFDIKELPSDVESGTYYMYLMTYEDGNEENQCASVSNQLDDDYYYKFSVESVDYEDSIITKGTELESQIDTYCGQENLEITIPVYNLGDDKEEKILVNLYNSELGIDKYIVIDNLDNGKKEVATFFINILSSLSKDKYDLDILISFDWDSDKPEDEDTSYNEGTSDSSIRLNILSCKAVAPSISANLASATKIGENLVIKTTIANNGDLNNFIVTPVGYESWADLVSVSPQTTEIASGNSKEVIITLSPKESGAQTFTISTTVDGEVYNQPVSVNIAEGQEQGVFASLGLSKTVFYLIIAIIVLFVLIFLVLLVKLLRRPAKANF